MKDSSRQLPLVIPEFDGDDYQHERDHGRLSTQLLKILDLMRDGNWRTLHEIAEKTEAPEASVSAQLRHLRKPRFGSRTVERRYLGNGLYEYRVLP